MFHTLSMAVWVQSMFNMVNSTCATDTTTALLNQATAGFANTYFRSSFNCTQEEPVFSTNTDTLDRTIFCGYKEVSTSQCIARTTDMQCNKT